MCLYSRYVTTAKQSSPHVLIYYFIMLYCIDIEKFYIRAVRSRYVTLCYLARDVCCIVG